MNLHIDKWAEITTPKGEKIKIHFQHILPSVSLPPSKDDENKINVYFYKVRDKKVREHLTEALHLQSQNACLR